MQALASNLEIPRPALRHHGQITATLNNIDVGSARLQSAQEACERLSPGGGPPRPADNPPRLAHRLRHSVCTRAHGVPNFPKPDKQGGFTFENRIANPKSSQFQTAQTKCRNLLS